MHKDFVKQETVTFKTPAGEWEYRPVTAGEENAWLEDYIVEKPVLEDEEVVGTKLVEDKGKLNWCRLRNIVGVPYTPETLAELTGRDKPTSWDKLHPDEKQSVLEKLHPDVFSKVLSHVLRINRPPEGDIKKSS